MGSAQRLAVAIAISLAVVAASSTALSAQPSASPQAVPSGSGTLAQLSATIKQRHPMVRALVLVRGNCIVHEYYRNTTPEQHWPVQSVTKSVLSILIGIAIDRGLLRLDQKLPELLAETAGKPADPRASEITLRDLLTMTSGFDPEESTTVRGIWTSSVWMINRPVKYAPGVHFAYDNPGTNLIAIILARAVGGSLEDFARRELFAPLGIDNYEWRTDFDGNLPGRSGLRLTARDMAKIGVLYLQHGRWQDRQVVSMDYVIDSTRRHNDGGDPVRTGYGYLWWTMTMRDGSAAYFAAGMYGQMIYNVPDRTLVAAVQSAESAPRWDVVNEVIVPTEAALPAQAPCIDRLE